MAKIPYASRWEKQYCGFTTPEELRAELPKVGDVLNKKPVLHNNAQISPPQEQSCKVVYVNEEHLWYTVAFPCGYKQSYKLPEVEA